MRRLGRILLWLALGLVLALAALAAPVVYVETMCRPSGRAVPVANMPLSTQTRPAVRTLLTYPEWHIVHAYDDYAEVIRRGDPQDYAYLSAIAGYWRSLCTLSRESGPLGEIDTPTRQMVHVIGVSFTVEMLFKAAYEETFGRIATWIRGPAHAPLDDLSATQAAAYARFLQQVPWYRYDFRADAEALDAAATPAFRDRERAFALGIEHRVRAAYAGVIAQAVAATGFDELTLSLVVTGLPPERLAATEGVTVLREAGGGYEVETPRYRVLTGILNDWAAEGADFTEIAGNDTILFTAISERAQEEGAMLDLPRQGYGDTRHLFLVPVRSLAETLRGLPGRGIRLEHIHDY